MSPANICPAGAPGASDVTGASFAPTFAAAAARLAGIVGVLLGWRPDEFWGATPAELATVIAALAGDDAPAALPPDAATIRRLQEAYPDG